MREWLKSARISKNLTQKDMGNVLGVSEAYYCAIENGERQKKMDVMVAAGISAATGVSIEQIVRYETACG